MGRRSRLRYPDHYVPRIAPFDDEGVVEGTIYLNPFSRTFYLGRGRFGDSNRLHRGIMIIRESESNGT